MDVEKNRVVKLLSNEIVKQITDKQKEVDDQRIKREAALSDKRLNIIDYDSLPKPQEITEISKINEMLIHQNKYQRYKVKYDKEILTNQEGVTSTLSEIEKQGRYPDRDKIENETLHKINTMMSKDRFKKYFTHMGEKAHLVSEETYKKCEEVIQDERDAFIGELGEDDAVKIFNDIDKFILDEQFAEQSIQASFENFEGIVSEHGSEIMSGILNFRVFEKYLEEGDKQKEKLYGRYLERNKEMRKKLFAAIDSISPDLKDGVSALDFIKFKVMYQIIAQDYEYSILKKNDKKEGPCKNKIRKKLKNWAKENVHHDQLQEEKVQITEAVHEGIFKDDFINPKDKDKVSYWHRIVKSNHTKNLHFIQVQILEPYQHLLNPISMDEWVKNNGYTREEKLEKYRSKKSDFDFDEKTMKQIYYLTEDQVLEKCEKIEEISQKAFLAFENIAYLAQLQYKINQAIKMWLFKKMYRNKYFLHFLEKKIKEHHNPIKKYEPSFKERFPFSKFNSKRTVSVQHLSEIWEQNGCDGYGQQRSWAIRDFCMDYKDQDEDREDNLCRQVDYDRFKKCLWYPPSNETKVENMYHFEESYVQGQKYIRVVKKQRLKEQTEGKFLTEYERDQIQKKERKLTRNLSMDEYSAYYKKKWKPITIQYCVMRFYLFNQFSLKFERQHESFYQVLRDENQVFTNDIFATHRNCTYFFRKDQKRNCFNLYRHRMRMEPNNAAETDLDKLASYEGLDQEERLGDFVLQMDIENPIEDMIAVFLKPAHQYHSIHNEQKEESESEFLNKQFVCVFNQQKWSKTNAQIFYLKDCRAPLINYKIKDLNFQAGWYIRENEKDKGKIKFILKERWQDITFEYEFKDDVDGFICEDELKPIKQGRDADFNRSYKGMYKLIHREFLMKYTNESLMLTYFHGDNYSPDNIQCLQPIRGNMREQLPAGLRNKESEIYRVLDEIYQYWRDEQGEEAWMYYDRDYTFKFNREQRLNVFFKTDSDYTAAGRCEYFTNDTMIIQAHPEKEFIMIFQTTQDFTWTDFQKRLEAEKDNFTQRSIFEQFDQRNQTVYQDNFLYQYVETYGMPNQCIKPIYKHQLFTKVTTTHNTLKIRSNEFKIDEEFLLIDLDGDRDGRMSMIKLYQKGHMLKWGLKLVRYQVSFSKKKVFFAFQVLNTQTEGSCFESEIKQAGLYFFIVKDLLEVKLLARQTTKKDENRKDCLINETQKVTVLQTVDKFIEFEFKQGHKLKEYQENHMGTYSGCANLVQFDIYHDTAQLESDHIIPFVFYSRIPNIIRKADAVTQHIRFKPYFALIDISRFKAKTDPKKDYTEWHLNYCSFILITQYKYQHENMSTSEGLHSLKWKDCTSKRPYKPVQLSRCSNWQKNLDRRSNRKEKNQTISTRFQIGILYGASSYMSEIRDIMITIDLDQEKNKNGDELSQFIKMDYIGMKYGFQTANMEGTNHNFGAGMRYMDSHYIVPKVDEEGDISGSYFMFNTSGYESQPIKLKSGDAYKKAFKKYKDDELQKWSRNQWELEGQWVNIVARRSAEMVGIKTQDGFYKYIPSDAVETFDKKLNPDFKKYRDLKHFYETSKKIFKYDIFDLNNDTYDKNLKLETNIAQLGYSKQVVNNQPSQFYMTVSTKLLADVIKENYFDQNMQMLEIHRLQQQMMCMSFINFKEVFRIQRQIHMRKAFFQPRLLLNGQNMCANDFNQYLTSIASLNAACTYSGEDANYLKAIDNSPLAIMSSPNNENSHESKNSYAESYFKMMGMNKYQNFQYDLNNVSIIQKGLDMELIKPVQYVLKLVQDTLKDGSYQDMIMQDFPQLLCSSDVKINDFVNRDDGEDQADDQEDESRVEDCNIEVKLREPELPFMGPTSIMEREFHEFDNIFEQKKIIETKIIEDAIEFQRNNPEQNWNMMLAGLGDGNDARILIDHYLMNFLPAIKKIKMDIMMRRKDKDGKEPPAHLARILDKDIHPADYNSIQDYIMADYIDQQRGNSTFFEQSSVCKLIDRQFQYTRVIYLGLLGCFTIGFLFPFIYGLFIHGTDQPTMTIMLFSIGGFTQFIYFLLELAEVYQIGMSFSGLKEYFVGWNTNDFTLPFMYTLHVFFYYYWHQDDPERRNKAITYNLITIAVLVQGIFKCLQYVRVIDSFGFLVEMIISVVFDLFPFIVIFTLMVTFFSFGIHVMGGEFDNGDYKGIPKPIYSWIQMFRNSIGDIAEVQYGVWSLTPEETQQQAYFSQHNMAVLAIWAFWFMNMFIMLIVILNFLIAEVSQTYDKVKSSGKTFLYLSKAGVNKIAFEYRQTLGFEQQDRFVTLVFKSPRDISNIAGGGDDMFGFTTAVKNELKKLFGPLKNELMKHLKRMGDTVEANKKGTEWQLAIMKNAVNSIAKQTDALKDHNDEIHSMCRELLDILPNPVPLVKDANEDEEEDDGSDRGGGRGGGGGEEE